MARWSIKKAEQDGATGKIECVYCQLRFLEQVTLHRHIRQNHRDEDKKKK
jgi:hypothetical protein